MTKHRQLSSGAYAGLKAATRALVRDGFGTQGRAAAVTRVGQGQISDYGSPNEEHAETFVPIDVVADLTVESGNTVVLEALAGLAGYVLVRLPQTGDPQAPLGRVTAQALKEVGDVFSTLGDQLADGVFTSVEDRQLAREIDEAVIKLLELKAQAHAVVTAKGGRP